MDHLELPHEPKHSHIAVPYLRADQYDGGHFETYPNRKGWSEADIRGLSSTSRSMDERAAFVQSWLFFGLLSTVFGPRYVEADWVDASDPLQPTVTLRDLEDRLSTLSPRKHHIIQIITDSVSAKSTETGPLDPTASVEDSLVPRGEDSNPLDISGLCDVLNCAHEWNLRVMELGVQAHILDVVCLSVAALGEFLCAYFSILGEDKWLGSTKTNFLFQRMLDDGWCPIEIIRLNTIASLPEIYFASSSERPGPTRDHRSCRERIPLDQMQDAAAFVSQLGEDWKCTAYHMDWRTYRTEHVSGCSGCDDLFADQFQVQRILERGYYPLVLPAGQRDQVPDLEVHRGGTQTERTNELPLISTEIEKRYVCISHVWSDGLGNPHENSIPRCQYERLSAMIDTLYPSGNVPFWIDTICVPRKPSELRRQTIMLMRKTYSEAEVVLILDRYLLDLVLNETSEREAWVRILNCGWMRRLWTLQECALARKALFQLRNGTLDLDKALWYDINTNDTWTLQWMKLRGYWGRGGVDLGNQAENMLGELGDVLAWRSTSIAEDEAVCLSIITGFQASEIEQVVACESHEDRMTQFWRLTKGLSSEILFWNGPRLSQQGMRWAPSSFLDKGPTPFLNQRSKRFQSAQLTQRGLRFKLPGLRLGTLRRKLREISFLRSSSTIWYRLVISYLKEAPCPPEGHVMHLGIILQEPELSFVDDLPTYESMAVLLVSMLPSHGESGLIVAQPLCVGTIERAERYEGWINPLEQLRGRFYSKVSSTMDKMERLEIDGTVLGHSNSDSADKSDIKAVWTDGQLSFDLKDEQMMFEIRQLPEHQEWCVG
ncbi:uncharacterized protein Z519_11626 [Cladophialophora bantiana CBS 173.52]|uniref:Heterokaryon incompatibility domain-containing protein n=1 Tax=Cladophialophora bantiana (strain ATCC 10958 / CBS 173.52 / CDC B-1940 / NIH 8579) TaxID=1442370 RepID=A0A0D2FLR2_CLAB1|nr:uncharacterized protein Z519_11626 [Cladophialophora bantiana CBS 173.52]KIW87652.1 hypothetical protein Z519_11626 [Cladophialophora bantiana CBS 173.52]